MCPRTKRSAICRSALRKTARGLHRRMAPPPEGCRRCCQKPGAFGPPRQRDSKCGIGIGGCQDHEYDAAEDLHDCVGLPLFLAFAAACHEGGRDPRNSGRTNAEQEMDLVSPSQLIRRQHAPRRVEDWRVYRRLRWILHSFRCGPQSGCHGHVSSPRRLKRSMRISRTPLSCGLLVKGYETYHAGDAFGANRLSL